jgi:hypothetical protein
MCFYENNKEQINTLFLKFGAFTVKPSNTHTDL